MGALSSLHGKLVSQTFIDVYFGSSLNNVFDLLYVYQFILPI